MRQRDLICCTSSAQAPLRTGLTAFRLIGTEGPVILCLHGAFSFSYIYQDLVRRLQRDPHDHPVPLRILLLDFHGRGRSPWPGAGGGATAPPSTDFVTNATEFFTNSTESSNCTLELLATQVEGLLAHLGLATEPAGIIIVGHDMGAAVGAAVAARSPGLVSGLVMLSPAGVPREVTEMERALDTPLLGTWMFRSRVLKDLEVRPRKSASKRDFSVKPHGTVQFCCRARVGTVGVL